MVLHYKRANVESLEETSEEFRCVRVRHNYCHAYAFIVVSESSKDTASKPSAFICSHAISANSAINVKQILSVKKLRSARYAEMQSARKNVY